MATAMKKTAAGKNPTHIKDLVSDPKNARRHNPRNIGVVADSLNAVGAARSIVVDENNVVMAGNGVLEAAAQAGITKLQIVEADGETIIAVKRRGLTKKQKTQLALADNRANELSEWDTDNLADLLKDLDAEDLQKLALTDADLKAMDLDSTPPAAPGEFGEVNENIETEHQCPKCGYKWSGNSAAKPDEGA